MHQHNFQSRPVETRNLRTSKFRRHMSRQAMATNLKYTLLHHIDLLQVYLSQRKFSVRGRASFDVL